MKWGQQYKWLSQYKRTSRNQYADRYKLNGNKRVSVAVLTAKTNNAIDLLKLILLSHHLDVPVRYDFNTDPHTAYIKVVGEEAL